MAIIKSECCNARTSKRKIQILGRGPIMDMRVCSKCNQLIPIVEEKKAPKKKKKSKK